MHWKPRRAVAASVCLLLHKMGFARLRWKTMGLEFRQRVEKRFSSLFSPQSRKEQDWVWRLWRAASLSLAARWIGRAPCGMEVAHGSASRCRWKKQKSKRAGKNK